MDYWQKRQNQLQNQLEKNEEALRNKLSNSYDAQVSKLEKQIAQYYKTYGTDNVIEYRNLMEQLPDSEKKLLIENMDEFAQKYPQYQHLMPVRESIYKLNRLEGMQQSIYLQQMEIGAKDQAELEKHLRTLAEKNGQNMADMMGFGKNFYTVNPEIIANTINAKWCNGQNFSDRIWNNRKRLAEYLNNDFAQAMARGDSYERCMKQLRARFGNVSRRDMFRLIYTEGTYVMNESMIIPFMEDFQEYAYSTVGDSKVCKICQGMNGKQFKMSDRKPGINFPPMHSCCRCSFTIVIPDDFIEEYVARHGGDPQQMPTGLKNLIKSQKPSLLDNAATLGAAALVGKGIYDYTGTSKNTI